MMKKQRKAMSTTTKMSSQIPVGCTHSIFVSPVSAFVTFVYSSCAGGVRRALSSDQVHTRCPHHAHLPAVALAKRTTAHLLRQHQVRKDEHSVDDDESHNGRLNLDVLEKHPEPLALRQLRSVQGAAQATCALRLRPPGTSALACMPATRGAPHHQPHRSVPPPLAWRGMEIQGRRP